jgi:hypothetical protein
LPGAKLPLARRGRRRVYLDPARSPDIEVTPMNNIAFSSLLPALALGVLLACVPLASQAQARVFVGVRVGPAFGPRPFYRPYYRPFYRPVFARPFYRPFYRPLLVVRPLYLPPPPIIYRRTVVYRHPVAVHHYTHAVHHVAHHCCCCCRC